MDISGVNVRESGWSRHEDIEKKLSQRQTNGDKNGHRDVHGIVDGCQLILCNAMGFSRLARQCDDKSLNILVCQNVENNNDHVLSTDDTFVEVKKIKKSKYIYNFETKIMTEIKRCAYGLPDTLFLTQIFNQEKYDSIPNDKQKRHQIFSARGMRTTSLYTKKIIGEYRYWKFCRRCETTFDFSTHSPAAYKNILISSKLLCIVAFDTKLSPTLQLSFRRVTGGYSGQYSSDLIGPSNDCYGIKNSQSNFNNFDMTEFGISLRNCDVFGTSSRLSLKDLSNTVFDCVLLDTNNYNRCDNDKNIILTLLLICKALPHVDYCFEFIKIKIVFSYGYKNLLLCCCQRHSNNVSINNNVNLKKMFNKKNQSPFGWNHKTATFKTECVKIHDASKKNKVDMECNRLVIIVVKTASHHIILHNYDLNDYVILKLNHSVNNININSNTMFPYVCFFDNPWYFLDLLSFFLTFVTCCFLFLCV